MEESESQLSACLNHHKSEGRLKPVAILWVMGTYPETETLEQGRVLGIGGYGNLKSERKMEDCGGAISCYHQPSLGSEFHLYIIGH